MDFQHPVEAVIPGAQGRVLAVLLNASGELNLRTIARLSRVSLAQTSRVVPGLVSLGLVERREVPPRVAVPTGARACCCRVASRTR